MKREISPVEFATAVRYTLDYRARGDGMSSYEAADYACSEAFISKDWIIPILSFINDSPSSAEAWCERMQEESLQRIALRIKAPYGTKQDGITPKELNDLD